MAKQGQHNNDSNDSDQSKGPNNPSKSVAIDTGTPKKKETYAQQAAEGKATDRQPQPQRNDWNEDTRDKPTIEDSPRARDSDIGSGRSGSDSNAGPGTRGG
ncbi:MAG TPA: hypothetical protein VFH60_04535 [Chloroflexia bacterium]|nr:hypothetical protein [Chloroflexia bacterium]HYP21902.1 hypothetical protein [Chloroflexia bacterium]